MLSKAGTDNTFKGLGNHHFWPGFQTSCYDCHRTPTSDNTNTNKPAAASNLSTITTAESAVSLQLNAVDPEGLPVTVRIPRGQAR